VTLRWDPFVPLKTERAYAASVTVPGYGWLVTGGFKVQKTVKNYMTNIRKNPENYQKLEL
jgi:hypothetical protein